LLQARIVTGGRTVDGKASGQRLLAIIRRHRTALQKRGFNSAARLYASNPRQFQRKVEALERSARARA
jgi:hypothetical protein